MSSAGVSPLLRFIRNLSVDRKERELADQQLLERFAALGDEAAFAALLRRHGPMVLRVCQSVLHNLHDAEDVFQAAFLVLARKAASIHRRESVSSWLYRVAYHLAVKAQASAARRKDQENRAAVMPSTEPLLDMSLRELQCVLNEEIQRLPEQYRAPVVLCGLEEKSLEEAARMLGWSKGCVKGRLQRGREQLRARLRRRGLDFSAGLLASALAASSVSAQVSAALTASTLRAAMQIAAGEELAAGAISANVAALVEGASTMMFVNTAKIVTVLLLTLSAAVAGVAAVRHGVRAANPPEDAKPAKATKPENQPTISKEAKPEPKDSITVHGRVFDPDGKPAAGAKLYLSSREKEPTYPLRATSDDDGRFHFGYSRSGSSKSDLAVHAPPLKVLAVAQGYGCAWEPVGSADKVLTLRLVKDAAVSGRILDPDGKPVANAKLTVDGVAAFTGAQKSGVVFAYKLPYQDYPGDSDNAWLGPLPDQGSVLTTSSDGRFTLTGVGPNRVVSLHLEAPGIATTDLGVISGTSVQHVAVPSRPIRGVVRDKTTGQPLAGATVFMNYWSNEFWEEPRWGKTVTDKEGRYELLGLEKPLPKIVKLIVKPAKGQLYFYGKVELRDTPGLAALVADMDMVQGLTVRGKVTDKATHKPIEGTRVFYYPLFENPHASSVAQCSMATTEPDGSYALTVHPGPGVIAVVCPNSEAYMPAFMTAKEQKAFFTFDLLRPADGTWVYLAVATAGGSIYQTNYNALVLLEPKERDKALVKDIVLERARELKGRVLGPDGQPIAGVTVFGLSPRLASYQELHETLEGAEFTVRGINPRRKRLIVFQHRGKSLGYCLKELPDEKHGPLTIKLQPCGSISGRIVDADGMPAASGRVYVQGYAWAGDPGAPFPTLDKEGRFHVKGLVPGLEYSVNDNKRPMILLDGIVVEPGKNKDLGDIKVSDN
jgi:RNA polymerase sigma factor (sigma-70 family)